MMELTIKSDGDRVNLTVLNFTPKIVSICLNRIFDDLGDRFCLKSSFGNTGILCVFRCFQSAELGQKMRPNRKKIIFLRCKKISRKAPRKVRWQRGRRYKTQA